MAPPRYSPLHGGCGCPLAEVAAVAPWLRPLAEGAPKRARCLRAGAAAAAALAATAGLGLALASLRGPGGGGGALRGEAWAAEGKFNLLKSGMDVYHKLGGADLFTYKCPPLPGMAAIGASFVAPGASGYNHTSCCEGYDQLGWPYRFPECANASGCECPTCWRATPVPALEEHPAIHLGAVAWAASSAVYAEAKPKYGMASTMAHKLASMFGKKVGSARVKGSKIAGSMKVGLVKHSVPNMCPAQDDWEMHMLNEDGENIHARVFKSPGAKLAMVVFRGTEVTSAKNMMVDADIKRERLDLGQDGSGRPTASYVHEGFLDALGLVLPQVRQWVNGNLLTWKVPEDWTLVFAGHSLGGALALLAATEAEAQGWSRRPDATVVFGSPRVADDTLDKWWRSRGLCGKLLRVNAYNDVIHWMPFVKPWKWWQVATNLLGCFADMNGCLKHGLSNSVRSGANETVFSDRWTHVCNESEVVVPSAMKGVNERMEDFSPLGGTLAHSIDQCLFGYGYGVLRGGLASRDAYCGLGSSLGAALCGGAS